MKKRLIVMLVGLFLMAFTGSVFAWSGNADISGKPDDFSTGGHKGYYIWQDDEGFHIWTTTRGEEHVFSGVIRTDGDIVALRGQNLERNDIVQTDENHNRHSLFDAFDRGIGNAFNHGDREIKTQRDQIRFKFDTTGGSDGLNFNLRNARYIDFDLYIDGHPINRREIHISESAWHPTASKFRLNQ